MTQRAAEWVIGEPEKRLVGWRIPVLEGPPDADGDLTVVAQIWRSSPEECRRLAALFRASEAMKEVVSVVAELADRFHPRDYETHKDDHPTCFGLTFGQLKNARAALRLATPP